MTVRRKAIAMVLLLALAGCSSGDDDSAAPDAGKANMGGTGAGSGAPAAKWSEIYPMIFPMSTNPRCDACHGMPANDVANGNLFMGKDSDSAYAALVGQKSKSSRCMERTLVVPGKPDESLMLLNFSPNPPCGNRMPIGGTPFTDAQLDMIRSWIAGGAKKD